MSSSIASPIHYYSSQSQSQSTTLPPLFNRKTMSITQTYYLAHTARGKLSHEAARPDHNLRFLVGHANLLDALMLELAEAEQEQESWFNQSVRGATRSDERHIQWADALVDEPDEDWRAEDVDSDSDSDSDSNSDYDEDEELETSFASFQRVDSYPALSQLHQDKGEEGEEEDEEEYIYEDDGEEDYAMLVLSRTPSHPSSPPELSHDSEEDSSEDESMPPSPPSDALPSFDQKQRQSPDPKLSPSEQAVFFDGGFYLPSRNAPALVSSICVY